MKFNEYTELSGFPWIKLFMSCSEQDDMDVNIIVRKINRSGQMLEHPNYPMPAPVDKIPNSNVAKFQGPTGILRASHRISQDPRVNDEDPPSYNHRSCEKIVPGTVIGLEIPIWPIGMVFDEGEGIAIVVAGHDLKLPEVLGPHGSDRLVDHNAGRHIIHTGGDKDSFVMLPFIT